MNPAMQSVHGASYRGVYDLADLDRSLFMITPGQSGNPFSSHARDFVLRWRDGATITLGAGRGYRNGDDSTDAMSYATPYPDDDVLVEGALTRRCLAWVVDVILIAILVFVLWWILAAFGILTFGLGFGAMGILPFVPFFYHFLSLLSGPSATPGQQMFGLTVRRDYDLGPPEPLQALVSVIGVLPDPGDLRPAAGRRAVHHAAPHAA